MGSGIEQLQAPSPDNQNGNAALKPTDAIVDFITRVDAHISPNTASYLCDHLAFEPETGIHTIQAMYLTALMFPTNKALIEAAAYHDWGKYANHAHISDLEIYRIQSSRPQDGAETRTPKEIAIGHLHPLISMIAIQALLNPEENNTIGIDLLNLTKNEAKLTQLVAIEHHETDFDNPTPSYPRRVRRMNGFTKQIENFCVIDLAVALMGDRSYRKTPLSIPVVREIIKAYYPKANPGYVERIMQHITEHETFFRAPNSSVGPGMTVVHHSKTHQLGTSESARSVLELHKLIWKNPRSVYRIQELEEDLHKREFIDPNRENHNSLKD